MNSNATSSGSPSAGRGSGTPRKRSGKGGATKPLDTALLEEIRGLAARVSDRLLSHLPGAVLLQFTDTDESLFVQGRENGLEIEVIKEELPESDCLITMLESDFTRVIEGGLNPQVAMLSDKIRVEGKMSLAVYFFNVFAPQDGSR